MGRRFYFNAFLLSSLLICLQTCGQNVADSTNIWNKSVAKVIQNTATPHPKITGGCITLTSAGLSTSLIIMALEISKAKQKDDLKKNMLDTAILELRSKLDSANLFADYDLHAFEDYLKAGKLPDSTPSLVAKKKAAIQQGLFKATASPITAAELLIHILKISEFAIPYCHRSVLADLGAGSEQLKAALDGILLLAESNLSGLEEEERANFKEQINKLSAIGKTIESRITTSIQSKISY